LVFLTFIVVGTAGLFAMALPAFGRAAHFGGGHAPHAVAAPSSASSVGGGAHASLASASGHAPHGAAISVAGRGGWLGQTLGFFLSPRAIFSVIALYGAAGNALVRAGHLAPSLAALVAVVPAVLVERLVVAPLWNLMFRYQGVPSSSLDQLLLTEARAVTPFKNGRGIVAVERDGRRVQFMARLAPSQAMMPVRVGTALRVEEVDAARECLLVAIPVGEVAAAKGDDRP
jgi:hypothetical protein